MAEANRFDENMIGWSDITKVVTLESKMQTYASKVMPMVMQFIEQDHIHWMTLVALTDSVPRFFSMDGFRIPTA